MLEANDAQTGRYALGLFEEVIGMFRPFCYDCWKEVGSLNFACSYCEKWDKIQKEYERMARELKSSNYQLKILAKILAERRKENVQKGRKVFKVDKSQEVSREKDNQKDI